MKSFSAALISLSLIASGAYYLYTTNPRVREYVSDAVHISTHHIHRTDNTSMDIPVDTVSQTRDRTPKTVLPDSFSVIDAYAKNTPKQYEKDIQTLADYLILPASTDLEKARVVYTWVATHILYDDAAFNSGNYPDYSAANVLRRKKAVCEGYANLLKALCEAAGLECEKITGYAKGYGYRPGSAFTSTNHAWNAIKINDAWKLFDATWGSSSGKNTNGKLVSTSKFDPFWFDVHPKAFIFTHLPEEKTWQLTEPVLTLQAYQKLPYISASIFKLGFAPEDIYNDAVSKKVKAFVEAYALDFPTQCRKLPYTQSIYSGKEIVFEIESDYADKIALIDNGSWHYFTKEGNRFTLTHKPVGKEIKISVKINWFDKSFSTIAEYKVTSSASPETGLQ